jgi:hypothetical protein
MHKLKSSFAQFFSDDRLRWAFILPSAILLALFALPLFALVARSISEDFSAMPFQSRRSRHCD